MVKDNTAPTSKPFNPAQFLMAKAYRGVAYVDAHHNAPAQGSEGRQLHYRGVAHVRSRREDSSHPVESRRFIYRCQSYRN